MKKFIATIVLSISALASYGNETCKHSNILNATAVAAGTGAAVALLIPGVGPVVSTALFMGGATSTMGVAVCAYNEKDVRNAEIKFNEWKKKNEPAIDNAKKKTSEAYESVIAILSF